MASATSGAEYYKANRNSILKKQQRYRDTHKDEIKAYAKTYYKENREQIREYQKGWRERNRKRTIDTDLILCQFH